MHLRWWCFYNVEWTREISKANDTVNGILYETAVDRKAKILDIIRTFYLPNNPLDDIIDQGLQWKRGHISGTKHKGCVSLQADRRAMNQSVAFTAVPFFAMAAAWFMLFGLCLSLLCLCYCCCAREPYGYSRLAYALSLILLVLFTIVEIVGCAVLYTGQAKFHHSTTETLKYTVHQANTIADKLRNLFDDLESEKKIGVTQVFLPVQVQSDIDEIQTKLNSTSYALSERTKDNKDDIHCVLDTVRLVLIIISAVMLFLTFIGDNRRQPAQALVRFNSDWIGFNDACAFEKAFAAAHHSKIEWSASENSSGSSIYAWLARANDLESQGPIGDNLRAKTELKTVSDLENETIKCYQSHLSMSRMLKENDRGHQAYTGGLLFPIPQIMMWLPQLQAGKNVMIAAHGNSSRSIIMYLDKLITSQEVISLELSTGIPTLYIVKEVKYIRRGSSATPSEASVYAYTKIESLVRIFNSDLKLYMSPKRSVRPVYETVTPRSGYKAHGAEA
ncbi:chaperonin-like protein [Tanacetum coccineum]